LREDAIWWSFPVGTISSALLAYGYYRWGGWRANKPMLAQAGPARPRA
jgi:Na+-driven multidrug efflux pump